MRFRVKHILATLLIGVGLTLGVTTLLLASSPTHHSAGDVLCVVTKGSPLGPYPACDQVFSSVQDAVDTATSGQEVRVATGVYTDVHTRDGVTQVVYISKSISIHGGYASPFDAPPDPLAQPTMLDAQGQGRVIYIAGDITTTLAGLRITGGDAARGQGQSGSAIGGGIYAVGARVTVSASHVYSNRGSRDGAGSGGGLWFEGSDVTLMANLIRGNTGGLLSSGAGGGLVIVDSEFNLVGNQIFSNTAVISDGLGLGGGVAIGDSSGQFIDNQINDNIAAGGLQGSGGGVYIGIFEPGRVDRLIVQDNHVQNNVAGLDDGDGGGVYIFAQYGTSLDVQLLGNVIQNNVAAVTGGVWDGVGGGLFMVGLDSAATLTLRHNLVLSNAGSLTGSYGGLGGGMAIGNVSTAFESNQIVGNSAGDASALYFEGSQIRQQADILSGNVISRSYGGAGSSVVYCESRASASNLVVIDNKTDPDGAAIAVQSSSVQLVHATLARNSGGSGISVSDGGCPDVSDAPTTAALTNTIFASHAVGIRVTGYNTVMVNGVLWHQTPIAVSRGPAAEVIITYQVIGDPLFAADGYHITAGSAAIGRGVPTGLQMDIDNEVRPLAPALGADEYWAAKAFLPIMLQQQ